MRRVRRGNMFDAFITELRRVDAGEKMFSAAEQYRRKGQVHLVDQSGTQILADRRDPAAEAYILAPGRLVCAFERLVDPVRDKMKRSAAGHGERRTRIVGKYEYRDMVRRVVAPPSFPALVGPGAAHGSKHISSQDPRADVRKTARGKFVVGSRRAALAAEH